MEDGVKQWGRRRRAGLIAAAAIASSVLVAGCGGTSNSPGVASVGSSTGTTPGKSASSGKGLLAYARCMRAHGVPNFPDPGSNGAITVSSANGIDPNSPQFKSAQSACQSLAPGGNPSPAQQAKRMAQALKFSQCMRAHGVPKFPDPTSNGAITIKAGPGSGIDPGSPQFQAAQKACQSIFGGPKGGPPAGSKSTSSGSGSGMAIGGG
jgi:hypothetical protein